MHKTLDDNNELADMESDNSEFSTSQGRSFSVLAKSFEKFISLGVDRHIVFKDSLNFLPSSLDSLVKNLREEAGNDKKKMKYLFHHTFSYFKEKFPNLDESLFNQYLTRKGVYPYKYMDR